MTTTPQRSRRAIPDAGADLLGRRVCVHLNLTSGRWVISELGTVERGSKGRAGAVLAYADDVTLDDVSFHTNDAGVRYCRGKGGRWVCAWVVGTLRSVRPANHDSLTRVSFNPHRADSFYVSGVERPVYAAAACVFPRGDRYAYARGIV